MAGELKVTDITKLVRHGDFRDHPVTVFSQKNQLSRIFSANNNAGGKGLALILSDHHFDIVTSLPAFMQKHGCGIFCHKCQKFERKKRHICDAQVCTMCKCFCEGVDANNPLEHIRCAECGRGFFWTDSVTRCISNHTAQRLITDRPATVYTPARSVIEIWRLLEVSAVTRISRTGNCTSVTRVIAISASETSTSTTIYVFFTLSNCNKFWKNKMRREAFSSSSTWSAFERKAVDWSSI